MIFSFSRLNLYESCPYRFFKKYVLGNEEPITLPLALGKAVHKAIEDTINGVQHREAILNGLIEAEFHPEVTAEDVSFLASRSNAKPGMGKTEIHFILPLDDTEDAPMLQGYIDLVFNKGMAITDWKTNRVPYHVLDNHQVGLYAWAMNKLYLVPYVVGTLYFLRFKKKSSHCFMPADMEKARLWALGLANEINAKLELYGMLPEEFKRIFPAIPSSNCRHCPFAKECLRTFSAV
ncbi:PD-(D/E)XK nuclease family protein [Heyndrickxia sporothermodurans]|uniref:PD-(D/E)XK nuclease family protein n=1 Tax=Heyndrickxia sporothermodurans TaxID=46224 RepID=UPI002DBFBBEB|nr:PD-(D/E)XK nuclease family protein [Heyndrickxia sporothermodurans]MEB6549763.1 PD-(D/E)XK nuclease family protein [Heyndrickxia sporothermodurans]